MKKVSALILSAILSCCLLTACGVPVETPTTSASETGGEKIKITVTRWGEIAENDAEKTMVDKFNAENDAIEIVYDVVPGDGYGDRLTTSFSSGEGYDLFASGEGDFFKWIETGLASPMDSLMAADSDWLKDMNKSILEMGQIQGSQYYIVREYSPICLWYNRDVFDRNNVEYPTSDWTWSDLEEAAEKLTVKNADGTYESFGFNAQTWTYAPLTYMQSNGLDIISPDETEVEGYLNSAEMVAAIERYAGYSSGDDRISPNAADFEAFGDASAMLINGTLAMTLNGSWAKSSMESSGVNYGTAIVPGNHESYLCASGYAISSRCKNPEAAWEVLKALTGAECTALRAQNTATLPTIDSQLEEVKAIIGEQNMGIIDQLPTSVQPVGLRASIGNPAAAAFSEALERVIYKDGDTKTILDEAVQDVKTAMAD
ncbi:MAG: extracellular solute-binding protein [Clostridiales bacterium]|jgi:multiple sugar transport system substrate-binding protein|nr:extracellular solute-binding protein [Clostridiales bacterium]